eukprot:1438209-Rhodomonas_salina.1
MKTRSGREYCLSVTAAITIKGSNVKAKFHRPAHCMEARRPAAAMATSTKQNSQDKQRKFFKPVYNVAHTADGPIMEPRNAREALASPQAAQWLESIRSKMEGLAKKGTYVDTTVTLPKGARAIPTQLVFK